jgi:hypothetical protein
MRVGVAPVLTLCLLVSGCGLIMVGDPVEKQDIESEDDAQENLKAIRKMLDQENRPVPSVKTPSGHTSVQPESAPVSGPSAILTPVPSSRSLSGMHAVAPAKLPWSPPALQRPAPPERPVPAYTIPAPVGPDYAGTIRCAPDGMGGQRCAGR